MMDINNIGYSAMNSGDKIRIKPASTNSQAGKNPILAPNVDHTFDALPANGKDSVDRRIDGSVTHLHPLYHKQPRRHALALRFIA